MRGSRWLWTAILLCLTGWQLAAAEPAAAEGGEDALRRFLPYNTWNGAAVGATIVIESKTRDSTRRIRSTVAKTTDDEIILTVDFGDADGAVQHSEERRIPRLPKFCRGTKHREEQIKIGAKKFPATEWTYEEETESMKSRVAIWVSETFMAPLKSRETQTRGEITTTIETTATAVNVSTNAAGHAYDCIVYDEKQVDSDGVIRESTTWWCRDVPGGIVKVKSRSSLPTGESIEVEYQLVELTRKSD